MLLPNISHFIYFHKINANTVTRKVTSNMKCLIYASYIIERIKAYARLKKGQKQKVKIKQQKLQLFFSTHYSTILFNHEEYLSIYHCYEMSVIFQKCAWYQGPMYMAYCVHTICSPPSSIMMLPISPFSTTMKFR